MKAGGKQTLKMEAGTRSSETSVGFQRTTQHYTPEDRDIHNQRYANLKLYMYTLLTQFIFREVGLESLAKGETAVRSGPAWLRTCVDSCIASTTVKQY
jgi:hypothetical protein